MREVEVGKITKAVRDLCISANCQAGEDVRAALEAALATERSKVARQVLRQLLRNMEVAKEDGLPTCQDTGLAVVFLELGQEVHLTGGDINAAVDEGVRQGYREGYLRASSLTPLTRKNLGDNTPAILHISLCPGDQVGITVAPKGFGSENMSRMKLLNPSDGAAGVEEFVVETVRIAGGKPCPPVVVGVGVGGTTEKAALLAKQALLRPLGSPNPDPALFEMERRLLGRINALGVGPQGLGGDTTALGVHILSYPTHIAGLPVVVNMQCHASRHQSITL